MTPPVRVGTAEAPDGAALWFRADGTGPAMICCNGLAVTAAWRKVAEHFAATHTVVTWDYRGQGRSPAPPDPESATAVQCARDLWAVADRAGAPDAVLLGHSIGAQIALEAYRLRPDRVRAFVAVLGVAGKPFPISPSLGPALRFLTELGARNALLAGKALRVLLRAPGAWEALEALGAVDAGARDSAIAQLDSLDLRARFALLRDLLSDEGSALLAEVRVPTFVVAGERDLFAPLESSRELAARIPGAELLVIRGGTHAALLEHAELFCLALEKFLRLRGVA